MTTTDDIFIGPVLPEPDSTTEHRDLLQREVDRLTDELGDALAAKEAYAKRIKTLRAERIPLERAIRAMTPRNQR